MIYRFQGTGKFRGIEKSLKERKSHYGISLYGKIRYSPYCCAVPPNPYQSRTSNVIVTLYRIVIGQVSIFQLDDNFPLKGFRMLHNLCRMGLFWVIGFSLCIRWKPFWKCISNYTEMLTGIVLDQIVPDFCRYLDYDG